MNFEQAVRSGNAELTQAFLSRGQNPDKQLGFLGEPALVIAAEGGHNGVVLALLEAGANVDEDGGMGETALIVAARVGALETLDILIEAGADLDAAGELGMTGLMWASHWEAPDAMELLIRSGCNVNQLDDSGESALFHVIRNEDDAGFSLLLAASPDLSIASNECELTAVAFAAIRDCRHMVIEMLKQAAGNAPLIGAIVGADLRAIQTALTGGISSIKTDSTTGWPPILWAAYLGPAGAVKVLLESGANADTQSNGWSPLMLAARSDNETAVTTLLDAGAPANAADPETGHTALTLAAERGFTSILQRLIEAKADPNVITNQDGKTALGLAAENNHLEVVKKLLQANADPNRRRHGEFTPLSWTMETGTPELVQCLLDAGADATLNKCEALVGAASHGRAEIVKLLVRSGADPNVKSEAGRPLIQAVSSGDAATVTALLNAGADPNCVSEWREPAIMIAAEHGFDAVVEVLIAAKAKLNRTLEGQAIWMQAAKNGHVQIVRRLVESGVTFKGAADVKKLFKAIAVNDLAEVALQITTTSNVSAVEKSSGWTGPYFAALLGNLPIMDLFLAAGADLNLRTKEGLWPLHAAATANHPEVVAHILKKQGLPERNQAERTLRDAASHGHDESVLLLLEAGVDPNTPTTKGPKALFRAIQAESLECVEALVNAGVKIGEDDRNEADLHELPDILEVLLAASAMHEASSTVPEEVSPETTDSMTAAVNLHTAVIAGDAAGVQRCLTHGARPDGQGHDGLTSLCAASKAGNLQIAAMLLAAGANPNMQSGGQAPYPPLFWAAHNGHLEMINLLQSMGADVNQPGHRGTTPLMGAVDGNQPACVQQLIEIGADVNARNECGYSALFNALSYYCCKPDIAQILIDAGADFKTPIHRGDNELNWVRHAAGAGQATIVSTMIDAGLQPAGLRIAATDGHRDVVRTLLTAMGGPILQAIASSDAARLKKELANGIPASAADPELKWPPISWAAFLHEDTCLRVLLQAGAEPTIRKNGRTPLGLALQGNRHNQEPPPSAKATALLLIQNGAKTDKADYEQIPPIFQAVNSADEELLAGVINAGGNPNAKNHMASCLQVAVSRGEFEMTESLIAAGANVDAGSAYTAPPLVLAIRFNRIDVTKSLIANGAKIDKKFEGKTSLHWAVLHRRRRGRDLLLASKANPNAKDGNGDTPLHLAVDANNVEACQKLLVAGATCGLRNKSGESPLMRAARYNHVEIILLLHNAGAKLRAKDKRSLTPQEFEALKTALGKPHGTPTNAWPKLSWLAVKGDLCGIAEAIHSGVDNNEQVYGYSALMRATQAGRIHSVRMLIKSGVDPLLKNQDDKTAFDLAVTQGSTEIAKALAEVGGGQLPKKRGPKKIGDFATSLGNTIQTAMAIPADTTEHIYKGAYDFYGISPGTHEKLAEAAFINDRWFNEPLSLQQIDQAMESANLIPLGDLRCAYVPQAAIRGYADPDERFYGIRITTSMQDTITEFFSAFSDGSTLTTSTSDRSDSEPERDVYRVSAPRTAPESLLALHMIEIERRRRQGITPITSPATPVGLAKAMDDFLQRTVN